jgi:cytochrome c2
MAGIVLDYKKAHALVENNKKNGFFWDGYTLVKWTPNPNGYMQKNGMFRNNKWGFASIYEVNSSGLWEISDKLAKFI